MSPFTIHWSPVDGVTAQRHAPSGFVLFALWPSPVNPDACFEAAGFKDFGDADARWEEDAEILLKELLVLLSAYGTPRLRSTPLLRTLPWYRRWFTPPEPLDLLQQMQLPMEWDSLPECVIGFGDTPVTLRAGHGHFIFWIVLPQSDSAAFEHSVYRLAGTHPVVRTRLIWEKLL